MRDGSAMMRVNSLRVKWDALRDVSGLEARRWRLVTHVKECYERRQEALVQLKRVQGGHAKRSFLTMDEDDTRDSSWAEVWTFYHFDARNIDGFSPYAAECQEPASPKNLGPAMEFQAADARWYRAHCWLNSFTTVFVYAVQVTLNTDGPNRQRERVWSSPGVTNFIINRRVYSFLRSMGPHSKHPSLEFLGGPGPNDCISFQEIDTSIVPSSRKNVLRTGRAFSKEEVLPLIGPRPPSVLEGDRVCLGGLRLRMFKEKGLTCVGCGIQGTRFYKEKEQRDSRRWTLSLYAVGPAGNETLMTKDHIIPLSRGGPDALHNLQPMCVDCNLNKSNALDALDTIDSILEKEEKKDNEEHRRAHQDAGGTQGREEPPATASVG